MHTILQVPTSKQGKGFSDHNISWLKRKAEALVAEDDDSDSEGDMQPVPATPCTRLLHHRVPLT